MPPKPKSPKTVLEMIIVAIRSQPATPNGVSRTAISKYLKAELDYDNPSKLKQALKKAASSGKLVQTGQSFRVPGDAVVAAPPVATVTVVDAKKGKGTEAIRGDTVVVKYEGKLEDGSVFDSAPTFEFTLGAGDVIKGTRRTLCACAGCRERCVCLSLNFGL
jgi:FKBP-type peptidyl-prolyl cis-trans isomerase